MAYEEAEKSKWDHTASQAALTINMNRTGRQKAVTPAELNPFRQHEPKPKRKLAPLTDKIMWKMWGLENARIQEIHHGDLGGSKSG